MVDGGGDFFVGESLCYALGLRGFLTDDVLHCCNLNIGFLQVREEFASAYGQKLVFVAHENHFSLIFLRDFQQFVDCPRIPHRRLVNDDAVFFAVFKGLIFHAYQFGDGHCGLDFGGGRQFVRRFAGRSDSVNLIALFLKQFFSVSNRKRFARARVPLNYGILAVGCQDVPERVHLPRREAFAVSAFVD
ncbi:hypothetical protein R80B4_00060 [Fibrobacteres bacterium R8-0-B4]